MVNEAHDHNLWFLLDVVSKRVTAHCYSIERSKCTVDIYYIFINCGYRIFGYVLHIHATAATLRQPDVNTTELNSCTDGASHISYMSTEHAEGCNWHIWIIFIHSVPVSIVCFCIDPVSIPSRRMWRHKLKKLWFHLLEHFLFLLSTTVHNLVKWLKDSEDVLLHKIQGLLLFNLRDLHPAGCVAWETI